VLQYSVLIVKASPGCRQVFRLQWSGLSDSVSTNTVKTIDFWDRNRALFVLLENSSSNIGHIHILPMASWRSRHFVVGGWSVCLLFLRQQQRRVDHYVYFTSTPCYGFIEPNLFQKVFPIWFPSVRAEVAIFKLLFGRHSVPRRVKATSFDVNRYECVGPWWAAAAADTCSPFDADLHCPSLCMPLS